MRSTSLYPRRQAVRIQKLSDILLTGLFFAVVILVLFYFFDKGVELVAEAVVNV